MGRAAFIREMRRSGLVTAAVYASGFSRIEVYEMRKDTRFAAAWDAAHEEAINRIVEVVSRRLA